MERRRQSQLLGGAVGLVIRGTLDWFTVLCSVCGLAVLTLQSATWIAGKSTGELQRRCRRLASGVWWVALSGYAAMTAVSLADQPHILDNLLAQSPGSSSISAFAVLALAGLIGTRLCLSVGFDFGAFASASCLIAGLLTSVAAGQFPYLLNHGLTVYTAGSAPHGMSASAILWIPVFILAVGYNVGRHRLFRKHESAGPNNRPLMTAGD